MTVNIFSGSFQRIHFMGIGGSGMSPLAEILHEKGFIITGSDVMESDNVQRMRSLGIPVAIPQRAENLADAQLVVYTSAVGEDNPERRAAAERGLPMIERAVLLGQITALFPRTVAVTGTHGKTTTTSMLAQILLEAQLDPTVVIGGRLPLIGANGRFGRSDTMVCEACEFQDHYLQLSPAVTVLLNVDADHLEYFKTLENIIRSFHTFAAKSTCALIVNADDANAMQAIEGIDGVPVRRFSTEKAADFSAANITQADGLYSYDLLIQGKGQGRVSLAVPGRHNVSNSLAAAAAASECGATAAQIFEGLAHFRGAGRRFEFLGTFGGITVADDYAHHPTEIAATLTAAKAMPYTRVWAVFQPFTFSRTARFVHEFVQALSLADRVVVSDILGSRETNTYGVSSEQITQQMDNAVYIPGFDDISTFVAANAQPGDLVLTMGGGDVYKCARKIAKALS